MKCGTNSAFECPGVPLGEYITVVTPNPVSEEEASASKPATITLGGVVALLIVSDRAGK